MTQKYEPVEWTDETPTQPGTLINKARLDQMQSAHHFADGFEEVDAIPTEDPGTDYHKVVYCTADSTFYRWDGTEWTADIDDDTKRLLEAEVERATAAEQALDNSKLNKRVVGLNVTSAYVVRGTQQTGIAVSESAAGSSIAQRGLGGWLVAKMPEDPFSPTDETVVNVGYLNGELDGKADKADTYTKAQVDGKLADGSVTKLGTADVGSDTLPIKLVGGSPTPVADALAKDSAVVHLAGAETIAGDKTFTGQMLATGQRAYDPANTTDVATIATLDAYTPMVRTSGAQTIGGIKTFTNGIIASPQGWHFCATNTPQDKYGIFAKITLTSIGAYHIIEFTESANNASAYGRMVIHENVNAPQAVWAYKASRGGNDPFEGEGVLVLSDGTDLYLAWKRTPPYGGLIAREYVGTNYGAIRAPNTNITWYSNADAIILDNLDGYTVHDIADYQVRTIGAQTIAGVKTHTSEVIYNGAAINPFTIKNTDIPADRTQYGSSNKETNFAIQNSAGQSVVIFGMDDTATYRMAKMNVFLPGGIGWKGVQIRGDSSGAYVTAPARAYNASNTSDVATIATLDAYTPMVRTTGNQTIGGIKDFSINPYKGFVNKDAATVGADTWKRIYTSIASGSSSMRTVMFTMVGTRSVSRNTYVYHYNGLTGSATCECQNSNFNVRICRRSSDGYIEVWTNAAAYAYIELDAIRASGNIEQTVVDLSPSNTTEPVVGDVYSSVITPTIAS